MKKLAFALALLAPLTAGASCGSAFCASNTSWDVQGAWTEPGARFDLRYEHIRQDRLRSGRRDIAVGSVPRDHDELATVNRNLIAGLDYTFSRDWAVNLQLPLVHREHRHIETATGDLETWAFTRLGDARVLFRRRLATYETADPTVGTLGATFGLKLPTGPTGLANPDGEVAERSLQPGSGTTDLLAGLYYSKLLPLKSLSWFAQGLLQVPMYSRSDYRPGSRVSLDSGLRYGIGDKLGLLLQANVLLRGRDTGGQAETEDSGGRHVFISPGLSYSLSPGLQLYGLVQLPVYQYVNGVQLVARSALTVGLSSRF